MYLVLMLIFEISLAMHMPVIKVDCTSLKFISFTKRILPIYILMSYSDLSEQIISSLFNNKNYHLYHQARCFDCHSSQGMCFFFFFFFLWSPLNL